MRNQDLRDLRDFYENMIWQPGAPPFDVLSEEHRRALEKTLHFSMYRVSLRMSALKKEIEKPVFWLFRKLVSLVSGRRR